MFTLHTPYPAKGDQPQAIAKILEGFSTNNYKRQTLLGVTGSGKTFTMANVIAQYNKPTIILSHNKTLAAQLYQEMKTFFPNNAVEYFVSYFDYYQPESYVPARDLYIDKEVQVNEQLDRMRLSTLHSLVTRKDVIVVCSVSLLYGIGDPKEFSNASIHLQIHNSYQRKDLIGQLLQLLYERNDTELKPGKFRVQGECIDIIPGYDKDIIRLTFFDDELETITVHHPTTLQKKETLSNYILFSAKQFIFSQSRTEKAIQTIQQELEQTLPTLEPLEQHRLKQRTEYDIEMIKELGYCNGIENYSRHFDGRKPGAPPYTILDFLDDYLLIIDESHVTIPQIHGMYKGDRARKTNLVEYGFRLPSAIDNRPLKFEEFDTKINDVLYVSATPTSYEQQASQQVIEQIIRPTGLVDPPITIHPIEGQMDDFIKQATQTIKAGFKVLTTTLTKRMAEQLTEYLSQKGLRVRYLHSEIDTLDRIEIIRQLRADKFDIVVGINLLREGLDIPEVALVAIFDADKQGFLRNARSLIQTIGRAARNAQGRVIMYANKTTDSMQQAIHETQRRRDIQLAYNKQHGITPTTIIKEVQQQQRKLKETKHLSPTVKKNMIIELTAQMEQAAQDLDFELAIELREQIKELQ
ncbi:MAG: excinuclease ABC subunit UvrB [Candidatus Woesearchaeota archaeon]